MPLASPPSATRDTILDTARALLARHGYRKTSVEDVAREAGLSRRTLYLYFPSKQELILATIEKLVDGLLVLLEQEARATEPPDRRLAAMLELRVMHRFDGVNDHYQSLDEMMAHLRPAYLERRERWFAAEADLLARVLEDGMRQGVFARGNAAALAHTLVAGTNALLPYSLSPRELGARKEVERSIADLARVLVQGLRAEPSR